MADRFHAFRQRTSDAGRSASLGPGETDKREVAVEDGGLHFALRLPALPAMVPKKDMPNSECRLRAGPADSGTETGGPLGR